MRKQADMMSPRTQQFAQGAPSGDEETRMFEEGFNQMAYNVLVSKFPDLMPRVVTFKVLDSDVSNGSGVGAFVVQHDAETLYIPVVLADNQIKPLDMFYHKGLNVFLPLNNEWLDEVSQLTLNDMGDSVTTPKSLRRDVDIRHVMIPPTTGRYAYAAAEDVDITGDLTRMLLKLKNQEKTAAPRKVLLTFLKHASNNVKTAFRNILTSSEKLAAQVTLLYGLDPLCDALTKTAGAKDLKGGALIVADRMTSPSVFKDIFGERSPEAFQGMLLKGYVAKDNRKTTHTALQTQEPIHLVDVQESGFYRVFLDDGTARAAFILVNPKNVQYAYSNNYSQRLISDQGTGKTSQRSTRKLVIFNNGEYLITHSLIGEPLLNAPKGVETLFTRILGDGKGAPVSNGDTGLFVSVRGKAITGTDVVTIETSATDSKGTQRLRLDDGTTIVRDPSAGQLGFHNPIGTTLFYVPTTARFLPCHPMSFGEKYKIINNPKHICKRFEDHMVNSGAKKVSVKNAGASQFSVDGAPATSAVEAMKTAALKYDIPFVEAEELVKRASDHYNGQVTALVIPMTQLQKLAEGPMMDPAQPQAPAAPPPPPSPLDIAIGEANTQIQQQMANLQQQQMALQDKAQTMAVIQQRAQEIAQGGAAAIAQGAPPMQPQMPTEAASGFAGGMPPVADPAVGTMAGGSMSPAQAPAPVQNGNPVTSGAMMQTEEPSAEEIQQQVNPQFLEQAGALQDPDMFDAAAISSLAQASSFHDMVVDYVPTLERAIDNLGRVLLSLWMQEGELKERIGDEEYSDLEDKIRAVFDGLGEAVLKMNRNAIVLQRGNAL